MFTPIRLGFPRQTFDRTSYMGHNIPKDMVRPLSGYGLLFSKTHLILPVQLVIMNLYAGNRDPTAFDRPHEFLPERWLDRRKGRTDRLEEGGDKLGVPHFTYGAGRRVCPGIDSMFCFLGLYVMVD